MEIKKEPEVDMVLDPQVDVVSDSEVDVVSDSEIEFVPIILWKDDEDLFNLIKNEYNIVDIFYFTFNQNDLREKMEKLYYPYKISENDPRTKSGNIKILILKIENPIYVIGSRKGHIDKPLNQSIIPFKEKTREKYDFTFFYSADFLNESQYTFKVFDIQKYISNEFFANINDLQGVIWLSKKSEFNLYKFCLKRIDETPHYLYLNNEKKYYREYVTNIDNNNEHDTESFNSLIREINSEDICKKKINEISINVIKGMDTNKYIIVDGLHRASIYLNNNMEYIKCKVEEITFNHEHYFYQNEKNRCIREHYHRFIHEHYFDFQEMITDLEKNNVRYVITRGYQKLPLTPCNKLDIVCHPEDVVLAVGVMTKKLHLMNVEKIQIGSENMNYIQFKTNCIPNKLIDNTCFRIDLFDNIFFNNKNKICISNLLPKLFDKKIKYKEQFYIMNPEFEYFLLLIRICFDKEKLKGKHKNRLIELLPHVKNENDLFNYLTDTEKEYLISKITYLSVPIVKNYP